MNEHQLAIKYYESLILKKSINEQGHLYYAYLDFINDLRYLKRDYDKKLFKVIQEIRKNTLEGLAKENGLGKR
jgi:hypothetical protein